MVEGSIAARLWRSIHVAALMLAALGSVVAGAASGASPAQRIVAVGDLHGDFGAWQDIARGAGLIDQGGHWAAGSSILVQMGDITDREPDSLKIIRSLQQLAREAPRKGGKVYVILGNHEAMNLLGDNRYTTPGEYAAFADSQSDVRRDRVFEANRASAEAFYKSRNPAMTAAEVRAQWMSEHPLGWVEHTLAWSPSGELGRWASANPAILKLGDTLFVHGGISAEYAKEPLEAINARVAKAMAAADESQSSILLDPLGPLWYRGLVTTDADARAKRAAITPPPSPLTAGQELGLVLASYGAKRLIVAHTPSLKGVQIFSGGQLADIDTGNSRYYGGPLSWIEIVAGQIVPHSVARTP